MRVRAVSTKMKRVTNLKTNAAPNMTILYKGPRSNKNLTRVIVGSMSNWERETMQYFTWRRGPHVVQVVAWDERNDMKERGVEEAVWKEGQEQDFLWFRQDDIASAVNHIDRYHQQQNMLCVDVSPMCQIPSIEKTYQQKSWMSHQSSYALLDQEKQAQPKHPIGDANKYWRKCVG